MHVMRITLEPTPRGLPRHIGRSAWRHAAPDDQIKPRWRTPAFLLAQRPPHCCFLKGSIMATAVQDWKGARDLRQLSVKKVFACTSSPRLMMLCQFRATG